LLNSPALFLDFSWVTGHSEVTRSTSEQGALFRASVGDRDYYQNGTLGDPTIITLSPDGAQSKKYK
jgi:hypothetical protein